MNYIITARRMSLPISLERPVTRPVTPVADSTEGFRDARQQPPSGYVYRGDLLDGASDRAYRPRQNLEISGHNRHAIETYQKIIDEPPRLGQILDGYL